MKRLIFIILFCVIIPGVASAEYIYLKDGQIIQGAIVSEDTSGYKVKTKYQTRVIPRNDVVRIMYGERKLEPIYLIMNDGTTRKGFLVDQDAEKVIIREREDSPREITISKSDIRQMSGSEIVPLNPSLYVRGGYFYPINSGGAELSASYAVFAGSDINFQFIRNSRVLVEGGYINCGSTNDGLTMRIIPLLLSMKYHYYLGSSSFSIIPGISAGVALADFNDGENSEYRGFVSVGGAGIGFGYEIINNSLYTALCSDYLMFYDGKSMLHSAVVSMSVSYRFR